MFMQLEKKEQSLKTSIYSDFLDPDQNLIPINKQQAVITVSSREIEGRGQHSSIILEYLSDEGLARTDIIELVPKLRDYKLIILIQHSQVEAKPTPDSPDADHKITGILTLTGTCASHIITNAAAKQVLKVAKKYSKNINQKYFYSVIPMGIKGENLRPLNCTIFANILLREAGIKRNGFLESFIPSHLVKKASSKKENETRLGNIRK